MFKKIFIDLCNDRKVAPSAVCKSIGLSNAAFSCWDDSSVPRRATLQRIADYFGVSVDYLLGNEPRQKEKPANDGGLSEAERLLIELLRQIPEERREMVIQMIRAALGSP